MFAKYANLGQKEDEHTTNSSRNLQVVTFSSILCLIDKIYWAWDITASSYVVWGVKLNSNKDYLSREKCHKQDTL